MFEIFGVENTHRLAVELTTRMPCLPGAGKNKPFLFSYCAPELFETMFGPLCAGGGWSANT
jgi:hypothetical protein